MIYLTLSHPRFITFKKIRMSNFLFTCLLFLISLVLATPTTAKENYTFHGTLQVQLSRVSHMGDDVQPIRNVQVRVVRKNSPAKGLVGAHGTTNSDGEFSITRQFAKDRDGALPGRKDSTHAKTHPHNCSYNP